MRSNIRRLAKLVFLSSGLAVAGPVRAAGAVTAPALNNHPVLQNAQSLTLYTFDPDGTDSSVCNGKCAEVWPPILLTDAEAGAVAAPYGVTTRTSGLKQLSLNGKPLYLYFADRKPGDTLGDGLNGAWHVIPLVPTL